MGSGFLLLTKETICSVTENGFAVKDENAKTLEEALQDDDRIEYFQGAATSLLAAIHEDGVDIRSYFAWSMLFSPLPRPAPGLIN